MTVYPLAAQSCNYTHNNRFVVGASSVAIMIVALLRIVQATAWLHTGVMR